MFIVPISNLPSVQSIETNKTQEVASVGSAVPFADVLQGAMQSLNEAREASAEDAYNLAMGDISSLMPAIHPYCKGAAGPAHNEDYAIASFDKACMNSVKAQMFLLEMLLENNAAEAREIVRQFEPVYPSLEAYMADLDSLMIDCDAVAMNPDGTALLQ